jgi:hypothetical protein
MEISRKKWKNQDIQPTKEIQYNARGTH